jgi:large subunit ribosomal protein L9
MKVILQRDIPKIGKMGEIKDVSDGYARNYLFPRQLAVSATGGALKDHQSRLDREKEHTAKLLQGAQSEAEKMDGLSLTILAKTGTGTKLYGSITALDVADAIKKEINADVDKRRIGLVDPIKTLGVYKVPVRLHSDVTVHVNLEVMTEEELERRKMLAAQEAAKKAEEAAFAAAQEAAKTAAEAVAAESPAAEQA